LSTAVEYKPPVAGNNPDFEILWGQGRTERRCDVHCSVVPYANPTYETTHLLDYIEATVLQMQQDFPDGYLILAGDFNQLSDSEIVTRTGLTSVKSPPTRGRNRLDRLYVSNLEYSSIKMVKSATTSFLFVLFAIVAYTGAVKKILLGKHGVFAHLENIPLRRMSSSSPASLIRSTSLTSTVIHRTNTTS
jgi:hypothetical protein